MVAISRQIPPVSREEVIDAGKAIRDHCKSLIEDRLVGMEMLLGTKMVGIIEERFQKTLETKLIGHVERQVTARVHSVEEAYEQKTLEMLEQHSKQISQVQQDGARRLSEIEDSYRRKSLAMEEQHRTQVGFLQKVCEDTLNQISVLVQGLSIPAPSIQVNVPEQKAPEITVNVPESSVMVNVPEQQAPSIQVNVPEQQAPEVIVQVPQARLIRKRITYDEYNRPAEIEEQEA